KRCGRGDQPQRRDGEDERAIDDPLGDTLASRCRRARLVQGVRDDVPLLEAQLAQHIPRYRPLQRRSLRWEDLRRRCAPGRAALKRRPAAPRAHATVMAVWNRHHFIRGSTNMSSICEEPPIAVKRSATWAGPPDT